MTSSCFQIHKCDGFQCTSTVLCFQPSTRVYRARARMALHASGLLTYTCACAQQCTRELTVKVRHLHATNLCCFKKMPYKSQTSQFTCTCIHCYKHQQPLSLIIVPPSFIRTAKAPSICLVMLERNNSLRVLMGTQVNLTRATPAPVSTASARAIPARLGLDITATVTTTTRVATVKVRWLSFCGGSNFTLILR